MTSLPHAGHVLERARWAARAYADYDAATVSAIVSEVAAAGHAQAERFAAAAVAETGMGVVADKVVKHRACSRALLDHYRDDEFVAPRVDTAGRIVEIPRPKGVVLAGAPASDPVATVYVTAILALMTRNAVVFAPDPTATNCSADAVRTLAAAAIKAGAPDGILQVIEDPAGSLVEALRADVRIDVSADVYAITGNVPVFVDATADIAAAARNIVEGKAFDNSTSTGSESVLIADESVAEALCAAMTGHGAHILDVEATRRLREFMFSDGHLNTDVVGCDALWIASEAGLDVAPGTRVLVAPFDHVVAEEALVHVTLCPVLGMTTVPDGDRGIRAARAVVRIGGAGRSAAIHSETAPLITKFVAQVPVRRVSINGANGAASAWPVTCLQPAQLLNWTQLAYDGDAGAALNFVDITPWRTPGGPVPGYPHASNDQASAGMPRRNGHSVGVAEAQAGVQGHEH
jgi:acetaldehyde dehydrogenase/alcohol dehydrogenase